MVKPLRDSEFRQYLPTLEKILSFGLPGITGIDDITYIGSSIVFHAFVRNVTTFEWDPYVLA